MKNKTKFTLLLTLFVGALSGCNKVQHPVTSNVNQGATTPVASTSDSRFEIVEEMPDYNVKLSHESGVRSFSYYVLRDKKTNCKYLHMAANTAYGGGNGMTAMLKTDGTPDCD